jgi:hypothetical protein
MFPLDYGPVLLLMPFGSHLTVDTLPPEYHKRRLQVRLGCVQPSPSCPFKRRHTFHFLGQRGYEPRFWIWRPSFERQRDFNPPEQRAAQRALPYCRPTAKDTEERFGSHLLGRASIGQFDNRGGAAHTNIGIHHPYGVWDTS